MEALYISDTRRKITLGELCEAVADGSLPAKRDEDYYKVRSRDLRNFASSAALKQALSDRTAVDYLVIAG